MSNKKTHFFLLVKQIILAFLLFQIMVQCMWQLLITDLKRKSMFSWKLAQTILMLICSYS